MELKAEVHMGEDEIMLYMQAHKLVSIFKDWQEKMRSLDKYGPEDKISISKLRERWYEIVDEYNEGFLDSLI